MPTTEPTTDSIAEPATESATEPATESATDWMADPIAQPINPAITSPAHGHYSLRGALGGAALRCPRLGRFRLPRGLSAETGSATAEYAVATMAAVGFAGLLIVILRGDEVRGILTDLVRNALSVG